ncbi:MAG: hypothetical protein CMQ17_02615 [Gammaproteobacteria bacterium]|nr:hypothetical protein [Gammaproteobacteria bacterium]
MLATLIIINLPKYTDPNLQAWLAAVAGISFSKDYATNSLVLALTSSQKQDLCRFFLQCKFS